MQAISYLFSAAFIQRHSSSPVMHLIMVHIVIGLLSVICLPLIWHPKAFEISNYFIPLISAATTYMFAQYALYQAIHNSVASRVSPLLGLKILVLAVMGYTLFDETYTFLQWGAVGLCIAGALWLSASGGKISLKALTWVIIACIGYALSDISILHLMKHFQSLPLFEAALLSVSLSFSLCGLTSLLFLPKIKSLKLVIASAPAAVSWFIAMLFLFACFAEIGVVFGGIVQSSRGLISILLALFVAAMSLNFSDPIPPRSVLVQRILAASLMMLAITLFSLDKL